MSLGTSENSPQSCSQPNQSGHKPSVDTCQPLPIGSGYSIMFSWTISKKIFVNLPVSGAPLYFEYQVSIGNCICIFDFRRVASLQRRRFHFLCLNGKLFGKITLVCLTFNQCFLPHLVTDAFC